MENNLVLLGKQTQLASWVMLSLYVALVLLLLPRELRFLRAAEPSFRRRFVALDVAIQVCILLILVPCAMVSRLNLQLLIVILCGFTGLWVFVVWLVYLRYIYTYRQLIAESVEQLGRSRETLAKQITTPTATEETQAP